MQNIRVGLIGHGYAGATFHVPLIMAVDGLRLVRIASSSATAAPSGVELVASAEQIIHAADIDLVVIATPNHLHGPLARLALLAGKHVVLEKPFTVTSREAEELIALATARQRVLSVFHNRRWDNDFLTLRQLLGSGALGDVHSYHSHYHRYRPTVRARWREQDVPGAGTLYDLGAHLIDQALVLFGPPASVTAHLAAQRDGAMATDYFQLLLGYGTLRVLLESSSLVRDPGPRFQVHGTLGSFIKSGLDPQEDALKRGVAPGAPGYGVEDPAWHGRLGSGAGHQPHRDIVASLPGDYAAYYRGMRDAIRHGGPVPVPAAQALEVIRIIEHATTSAAEQRIVSTGTQWTI